MSRRDVVRVMFAGILLLGVNYGLLYWGARFIPSGLVAILQSSTPVLALALGWCLGSEIVTLRKVIALAAGVAGIFLTFRTQLHAAGTAGLLGSFAVLGSSLCVATAYVWLKRHGARVPQRCHGADGGVGAREPLPDLPSDVDRCPIG